MNCIKTKFVLNIFFILIKINRQKNDANIQAFTTKCTIFSYSLLISKRIKMKNLFLCFSLFLIGLPYLSAENYYWIGGTGEWSDAMHWSLSDLGDGVSAGVVPGVGDNVYFNEYSFDKDGDTIFVSQHIDCNEMDWLSLSNNVVFYFRPSAGNIDVNIGASLFLDTKIDLIDDGVNWILNSKWQNNLLLASDNELSNVIFDGTSGDWRLFGDLNVSGDIRHLSGELITDRKNITCNNFESLGDKLNLGSSTLYARQGIIFGKSLDLEMDNGSLVCTTLKASGFTLDNLTLLLGGEVPSIEGDNLTINNLDFGGVDVIDLLSTNVGSFIPTFELPAGETVTVLGNLLMSSICQNPVSLVSSVPGTQANLVLEGGGIAAFGNIRVKDVAASGGQFIAYDSYDDGNNSGWQFVGTPGNCGLNVEMSSFNASCENKKPALEWRTSTEINSDYFVVEVSSDGVDFKEVTQINAAQNSTNERFYTFTDTTPRSGQQYYRLKKVDLGGEYEYSDTVTAPCAVLPLLEIYPNPTQGMAMLSLNIPEEAEVKAEVYNQSGQLLVEENYDLAAGVHELSLPVKNLLNGLYIIRVQVDDQTLQQKFIKE